MKDYETRMRPSEMVQEAAESAATSPPGIGPGRRIGNELLTPELISLTQPLNGADRDSIVDYIEPFTEDPMKYLRRYCFVDFTALTNDLHKYITPPEKKIPGLEFSMQPDIRLGWARIPDCFTEWGFTRSDNFGRDWRENNRFDVEAHLPWLELPEGEPVMLCHHWNQLLDFAIADDFYRPVVLVLADQAD